MKVDVIDALMALAAAAMFAAVVFTVATRLTAGDSGS